MYHSKYRVSTKLQLLEILKISWDLKSLLGILENSWNFVVRLGKMYK